MLLGRPCSKVMVVSELVNQSRAFRVDRGLTFTAGADADKAIRLRCRSGRRNGAGTRELRGCFGATWGRLTLSGLDVVAFVFGTLDFGLGSDDRLSRWSVQIWIACGAITTSIWRVEWLSGDDDDGSEDALTCSSSSTSLVGCRCVDDIPILDVVVESFLRSGVCSTGSAQCTVFSPFFLRVRGWGVGARLPLGVKVDNCDVDLPLGEYTGASALPRWESGAGSDTPSCRKRSTSTEYGVGRRQRDWLALGSLVSPSLLFRALAMWSRGRLSGFPPKSMTAHSLSACKETDISGPWIDLGSSTDWYEMSRVALGRWFDNPNVVITSAMMMQEENPHYPSTQEPHRLCLSRSMVAIACHHSDHQWDLFGTAPT